MRSCFLTGHFTGKVLALTIAVSSVWPSAAQNPAFRADTTLVLVPVTVVDRRGATVNGLASDDFTITENGVRQPIRSFTEGDVPVSLGIVLDLSGSMKRVLGEAKASLRTLMKDANPGDETFLNTVSTRPRTYSGFTHDFDDVLSEVAFEQAGGDTALFDTVYDSLKTLRSGVHTRKALVVISDGMDNHSRFSKAELLSWAMESDAQIYTIAVDTAPLTSKPIQVLEEKRGLMFLDELAAKTGGLSFVVRGRKDIDEAAARINLALRDQYTIGYVPGTDVRTGQWRRIRVRVAVSGTRAYARAGYRSD